MADNEIRVVQVGTPGPAGVGAVTGAVSAYAGSSAPTGYVLCDGASLLRAGTYAALFAVCGTTYGSVDGTHFNVPDLRGRSPVGLGPHPDVNSLGDNEGEAVESSRTPKHAHDLSFIPSGQFQVDPGTTVDVPFTTDVSTPPYLTLNFIIKT